MTMRAALSFPILLWFGAVPHAVCADTPSLSQVFRRVDPSVVEIHVLETDVPERPGGQPVRVAVLGSGVLIAPDGKVLTAAHVVQTADVIEVQFLTGETLRATVLSSEESADTALLQLERPPKAPIVAAFGDSDDVSIGDEVFVIGAPLGVSHTLTVGHISGRRRTNATFDGISPTEYFQTDASINHGNSGGPLFNMRGEIIGIVAGIVSTSGGSEGLGFAVTSKVARQIQQGGLFWSGVDGYLLAGDMAQVFNVPPPGMGLLLQRVAADSPAERLGLRGGTMRATIADEDLIVGGDIILEILGISLSEPNSGAAIRERLTSLSPGEKVTATVLRRGRMVALQTTAIAPQAP
jgi:S1-C subfamily serine protease